MRIRNAIMNDVEAIHQMINEYATEGLMLPRSKLSLYETLQCFIVAEEEETNRVVGVAGLHILWMDLSEIRSLAVARDYKGRGIGKALVQHLHQQADQLGIARVLSLTYQVDFFHACGYEIVKKESLPHKVWKDCINCSKFPSCDENAMLFYTSHFNASAPKSPEPIYELPMFT